MTDLPACECHPDCDQQGIYTDRDGRQWCAWCHGNGVCTDLAGHYAHDKEAKKGRDMATKFSCPDCGNVLQLHMLERMYGITAVLDGFTIKNGVVSYDYEGTTEPIPDDQETVGIICTSCGWSYQGNDWEDYVANFEVREQERIQREFLREIGQLPPDTDTRRNAPSTWEVPLVHGEVKIIVPIEGHDPVVLTVNMNELDEPQDIHIDPNERTVSLKSEEPFIEVCSECDAPVPEDADSHVGDWHEMHCSLFEQDEQDLGFHYAEGGKPKPIHRTLRTSQEPDHGWPDRSLREATMAGDAPELVGTRKVYVYVTDKDDTRRLEQSLATKEIALNHLGATNWNSDDIYDGILAVSFDAPNNITDDEIHDRMTSAGMTAEIDNE